MVKASYCHGSRSGNHRRGLGERERTATVAGVELQLVLYSHQDVLLAVAIEVGHREVADEPGEGRPGYGGEIGGTIVQIDYRVRAGVVVVHVYDVNVAIIIHIRKDKAVS